MHSSNSIFKSDSVSRKKSKGRLILLGESHTAIEAIEAKKSLKISAKNGLLIYLDESLDPFLVPSSDYHIQLDQPYLKILGGVLTNFCKLHKCKEISPEEHVLSMLDIEKSTIKKNDIYSTVSILYHFKCLYSCFDSNTELKQLIEKIMTQNGIINSKSYLDDISANINLIYAKMSQFTLNTPSTTENVTVLTEVISLIFKDKENLINSFQVFSQALAEYLSILYPKYISHFQKVHDVLNLKLNANYFNQYLRNIFIAKNIIAVSKKFPDKDIVGSVGFIHLQDEYTHSIQTLLSQVSFFNMKNVHIIIIDEGFDIGVYLNHNFRELSGANDSNKSSKCIIQ